MKQRFYHRLRPLMIASAVAHFPGGGGGGGSGALLMAAGGITSVLLLNKTLAKHR